MLRLDPSSAQHARFLNDTARRPGPLSRHLMQVPFPPADGRGIETAGPTVSLAQAIRRGQTCLVAMTMSTAQISEEQITAMSHQERRELMMRLARASSTIVPVPLARRIRRRRLALNFAAVLVLLPWIVYLALSRPDHYVARNWSTAWVGFDVLLLVMFALTAILGLLRRQLLVLAGFGTGVLLICDAWFDVMTAAPDDRLLSAATALFVELPFAALLIGGALRLTKVSALRLWLLEPGQPLWTVPLSIADLFADQPVPPPRPRPT
jgi:hypothetical protein